MTIDQILKEKGGEVTRISSSNTLEAAAKRLDERKIGAVVAVDSSDEVVGVLSERDIVRQVARHGAAALSMSVSEAMTRDVITATGGESVLAGLERMTDRRVRHLPVVDENGLKGIVSIGDLVKWRIAATEAEAEAMKSYIATG